MDRTEQDFYAFKAQVLTGVEKGLHCVEVLGCLATTWTAVRNGEPRLALWSLSALATSLFALWVIATRPRLYRRPQVRRPAGRRRRRAGAPSQSLSGAVQTCCRGSGGACCPEARAVQRGAVPPCKAPASLNGPTVHAETTFPWLFLKTHHPQPPTPLYPAIIPPARAVPRAVLRCRPPAPRVCCGGHAPHPQRPRAARQPRL